MLLLLAFSFPCPEENYCVMYYLIIDNETWSNKNTLFIFLEMILTCGMLITSSGTMCSSNEDVLGLCSCGLCVFRFFAGGGVDLLCAYFENTTKDRYIISNFV